MTRSQLEHILRAAAGITGTTEFVVVGSQAILGRHSDPPPELVVSIEADIFSLHSPEDADLIDGSIGEASPFHRTFGYYAHGVGADTATLPKGWKDRLIPLSTPATAGATGFCLEVHDLAVSKIVVGREKDLLFVAALLKHRLAAASTIESRFLDTPLSGELRSACEGRLKRLVRPGA